MTDNMELWNKVSKPPPEALKTIKGGRLQGMTDIKPQWRTQALTEALGPCGEGWKFAIVRLWTEPGSEGQVMAFAHVNLHVRSAEGAGEWSDAIPGIGGSMLIAKESKGPYSSDEAFKMAVTDALGSAMKMLGVAAEVYLGNWDGSKYKNGTNQTKKPEATGIDQPTANAIIQKYSEGIQTCKALPHLKNHMAKHIPEFEKELKGAGATQAQIKKASAILEDRRKTKEIALMDDFKDEPPPEETNIGEF
jgi:hypothetical protein